MTLKDICSNQRLGGRSVSDISADGKLAAYVFSFFLFLQQDIAVGELVTDCFILEYNIKYLVQGLLFNFQVDAMFDIDFFAVYKGITG